MQDDYYASLRETYEQFFLRPNLINLIRDPLKKGFVKTENYLWSYSQRAGASSKLSFGSTVSRTSSEKLNSVLFLVTVFLYAFSLWGDKSKFILSLLAEIDGSFGVRSYSPSMAEKISVFVNGAAVALVSVKTDTSNRLVLAFMAYSLLARDPHLSINPFLF